MFSILFVKTGNSFTLFFYPQTKNGEAENHNFRVGIFKIKFL